MSRKTAVTRFAGWGGLAALALVAVAAWSQAGLAQEKQEESYRVVRYYQGEADPQPMLGVYVEAFGRNGLRVTRVTKDWPAEGAGIRQDDIIVRIDGHELVEPLEGEAVRALPAGRSLRERRLRALLREVPEGEAVEVTVHREGETLTFTVVPRTHVPEVAGPALELVSVRPDSLMLYAERFRDQYEAARDRLDLGDRLRFPSRSYVVHWDGSRWQGAHGLDLLELNPELGSYFGTKTGVLVADVADDSPLDLRPGDVVVAVDGRQVGDIAKLHRILSSYEEDEEIRFRIWRDGAETTVTGNIS